MYYYYCVKYYGEYSDKDCQDSGIVFGENMAGALENVLDDYGAQSVYDVRLVDNGADSRVINKKEVESILNVENT